MGTMEKPKSALVASFSTLFLYCGELIYRSKTFTHGYTIYIVRGPGPVFCCFTDPQSLSFVCRVVVWIDSVFSFLFVLFQFG